MDRFPPLAFPPLPPALVPALRPRPDGGPPDVLDVLRRRYVAATPEEWVRQHVAAFLVAHRGVPTGLVSVERAVAASGRSGVGRAGSGRAAPSPVRAQRFDLVVRRPDGRAVLLVECKAPSVAISAAVLAQAARYNRTLGAPLVLVTNGLRHVAARLAADGTLAFLPDVPPYAEMVRDA